MEKINRKRLLYTICFMVLCGIDFVRNTQNGDLWRAANNTTGLVMMVMIGNKLPVRKLVTPVTILYSVVCALAAGYGFLHYGEPVLHMYYLTFVMAVLNLWWIGIFGWYFFKERRKYFYKPWSKLAVMGVVLTALMIFSRSGRVWPLWFLVMFSMYYAVDYTREERESQLNGMIDGTILSFFCLQIFAYGFRPYDEVRYLGAFNNCNITALHYLVVYTMVLIRLHQLHMKGAKRGWKLFYYLGAAGMLGFQFLTMGRTAWISSIVLTLMYGFLVMKKIWRITFRKLVLQGIGLGLATVLLFPLVFATVRYLPTILHYPVWFGAEYSIEKVHSFDDWDSWKYVEMDEFLEAVFGRIYRTFRVHSKESSLPASRTDQLVYAGGCDCVGTVAGPLELSMNNLILITQDKAQERSDGEQENMEITLVGPKGMDTALNVRLTIYKTYLEHLNLLGHGEDEGHYIIVDQDNYMVWHAQNLWLQVLYSYGIPAGIIFLCLTPYILYLGVKKLLRYSQDPLSITALFICSVFFLYGIMEMVWNVGQLIFFLFFFVLKELGSEEGLQRKKQ